MESNESKILRIEEKFQDHVLTEIVNTDDVKVFDFKKPGTGTYSQRWVISGGRLIVTGDCYDSIYKWSSSLTLDFLANCNLSYFSGKCTSDKDGYEQKHFDDDHATLYMKRLASDNIFNNIENYITTDEHEEKFDISDGDWNNFNISDKFEMIKEFISDEVDSYNDVNSIFNRENSIDAVEFMTNDDHEFMFGQEAWEHESHLLSHTVTPFHHLAALRVANKKYPNSF